MAQPPLISASKSAARQAWSLSFGLSPAGRNQQVYCAVVFLMRSSTALGSGSIKDISEGKKRQASASPTAPTLWSDVVQGERRRRWRPNPKPHIHEPSATKFQPDKAGILESTFVRQACIVDELLS